MISSGQGDEIPTPQNVNKQEIFDDVVSDEDHDTDEDEDVSTFPQKRTYKHKPSNSSLIPIKTITKSPWKENMAYIMDPPEAEWVKFPELGFVPDHLVDEFTAMFDSHEKPNSKIKNFHPKETNRTLTLSLMPIIRQFFTLDNIVYLCKILLKKETNITLSTLDWLCMHYAREKNVIFNNSDGKLFDMVPEHDIQLKRFGRPLFGAFARYDKMVIEFRSRELEKYLLPDCSGMDIHWTRKLIVGVRKIDGKIYFYLMTAFGQLNFFKWAMKKGIIEYCEKHCDEINQHRNENKAIAKEIKKNSSSKKRRKMCGEQKYRKPMLMKNCRIADDPLWGSSIVRVAEESCVTSNQPQ